MEWIHYLIVLLLVLTGMISYGFYIVARVIKELNKCGE